MFAPCLLVRTDPAIRALSKRPVPRPMRGACPGSAPPQPTDAAGSPLDQWSRFLRRAPRACLESLCRCCNTT
jgi:hypothetical protein